MHHVFVYGTLKAGEPNHHVLQSKGQGQWQFLGKAQTICKYPLVIASKFNIPFLLDQPGVGNNIQGEIYKVGDELLAVLDEFEGHPNYYHRREEDVLLLDTSKSVMKCWAYFLPNYKPDMLTLPHLTDYRSAGDHGKPYIIDDDITDVSEIDV